MERVRADDSMSNEPAVQARFCIGTASRYLIIAMGIRDNKRTSCPTVEASWQAARLVTEEK